MYFSSIFWCTCILYLAESSHFRGGIITWKPAGNNQIEINYRVGFRRSRALHMCDENTIQNGTLLSGEGALTCLKGCSGSITTMSYYCTDFSTTEDWTTGTNSVKYNLSTAIDSLHFGFSGCCWINLVEGGSSWKMRTIADLTIRNDTGKINSSPISAMQPIIRFSYGCDYTLKIPVSDDDGDVVKCRWSTKTPNDECGGVCETLSGSYLDESSCILTYNATTSVGWYAVALQIEDFKNPSDTVPLSSVSMQFLIVVGNSSEMCASRPVLPTNKITDGLVHHISDNNIFNETIIARSGLETLRVTAIDTVSPIGMIKSELLPYGSTGREWFVTVTWKPTKIQVGSHLFCYTAVDDKGQTSEQICAKLVVDGEVADDLENDDMIVLNTGCNAFKTPDEVVTKCSEAVKADPPLFYLESSCPSRFVQCTAHGIAYIMPCGPGTEWCQQKLTCVHTGSCKP
ncbi:integrin beta-like protein C isoform X2 [Mytilus californianus]|uniref:integrin beta-like protein C isoform X2 n=1 Tax=Mytilus californianus TaxID=6549 RepID=UPI00224524AC|nr:integrin beta-like protein C isoform X2 [Mytilus californianus]